MTKPTYLEAKLAQVVLDDRVTKMSAVLDTFPKGAMGLTPDDVKFSPAYRLAKQQFDASFAALRKFNGEFTKAFAKEIREDRLARRRARVF